MTTTFGDFLREASEQMDLAIRFAVKGAVQGPAAVATISASRQMAGVLTRYVDNLIPTAPPAQRSLAYVGVWPASDAPRMLLHETYTILSRLDDQLTSRIAPTPHPVARHLSAAALALATGRDLLNTHFTPHLSPTDWANAIVHGDTRRALLAAIADQARQLAIVLQHTRPALRGLGLSHTELDRSIAALNTPASNTALMDSTSGSNDPTLTAIPLRGIPPIKQPPDRPQSIKELCQGIIGDAEAIRALIPGETETLHLTAAEWQRRATGAAATMYSAVHTIALLIRRANEIHPKGAQEIKNALKACYGSCGRIFQRWQAVRKAWNSLATETQSTSPSRLQLALRHLLTRMTRLASSDPIWTLGTRKTSPTKSPADLTPTITDMPPVILAIQHATEALLTLAQNDLTNVTNMAESGRILTRLDTANGAVYQYASHSLPLRNLLFHYRQVISYSSASFVPLRKAALVTSPPGRRSAVSESIATLQRRRARSHIRKMYKELEKVDKQVDATLNKDRNNVALARTDVHATAAQRNYITVGSRREVSSRPMHQAGTQNLSMK